MLQDALRYPYDGGDGLRTLAIGGVLTLLGFLVVPVFLVSGYTVRVLARVAAGEEHLPGFEAPVELLVDGLKAFAIGLAYLLVPALLLGGAAAAFFVPLGSSPPAWVSALAWLVAVVSLPATALALYALPAALVNFARTDRLGAAFAFGDLRPVLTNGSYFVAWALAIVVLFVSSAMAAALGVLALVGVVLVAFVGFYANLVAAYLYAGGFASASGAADTELGGGSATTPV